MEKNILSVTSLNLYIKNKIEDDLTLKDVYVQGEVTNLTKHYTGHYYFSIKDENSKISCMMFSYYAKLLFFDLKEGDLVLIHGYLSVYEKNGTYQLYAKSIQPAGLGQELLKIEALKRKLKEEGIFDLPKKEIPLYPNKIGLITSSTGAAVKDLIHTIQSRWNVEIYIFPCLVQGENAPESIVSALQKADSYSLDTLIIGRGGGANEDLSAYNDERVVRAVIACSTPIISAIGHQIDSSVTDLVSDYSCITPTDAGIKATPNKLELIDQMQGTRDYLNKIIENKIDKIRQNLLSILSSKALISPLDKLKNQRLENNQLIIQLNNLINNILKEYLNLNKTYIARLNSLNPYGVLKKGYSLVYNDKNEVLTSLKEVKVNEDIVINFQDGKLVATVKEKQ